MRRKLVKQGKAALTLTLPSEWISKNNLQQGDEVEVIESYNSLNVMAEKRASSMELKVDLSGLPPRLVDIFLTRAYERGYDKMTIKYDSDQLVIIKDKVAELIGFEILNVEKIFLEIHTISSDLNLDFNTMLKRAFLILMDMAKTCEDSWKKSNAKELENVVYQDLDVNKFTYYCLRSLNKSPKLMTFGRSALYFQIEELEDLGDELKNLAMILSKLKFEKNINSILVKFNELFKLCHESYYSPGREKAIKTHEIGEELRLMIEKQLPAKDLDSAKALNKIDFMRTILYHIATMRLDALEELKKEIK